MALGIYIRDGVTAEVRDTSPRTAAYILYYHYVFRTKYNRPVLNEAVAAELIASLTGICEERGYLLYAAAKNIHQVLHYVSRQDEYHGGAA